jgi:parallel beta-helix repeat protein
MSAFLCEWRVSLRDLPTPTVTDDALTAPGTDRMYRGLLLGWMNRPSRVRRYLLRLEALEARTLLTTFTVVNTGFTSAGAANAGDLLYCINQVNADGPGLDTIRFAIPAAGAQTIHATGTLSVSHPVVIDGWTQGGAGYSGPPLIELDGTAAGSIGLFLDAGAAGSTVRGLAIDHFAGTGLRLDGADGTLVQGDYIGVSPLGAAAGNGNQGIRMTASGCTLLDNVISNNALTGVWVLGNASGTADGNVLEGNRIGTDPGGSTAMPNGNQAVLIQGAGASASNNRIGGTAPAQGNVISASTLFGPGSGHGLVIFGQAANTLVQGNLIGVDAAGTADLGNAGDGVLVSLSASYGGTQIGGTTVGAGNVIAFNHKGVVLVGNDTAGVSILGNSIHDNQGLGIDLGDDGITSNTAAPPGPNDFQHRPVLSSVASGIVTGSLPGTAGVTYRIEFFASPVSGPAGQGAAFLGAVNVASSGGNIPFSVPVAAFPAGWVVTATATDLGNGDTSEFSAGPPASIAVTAGNHQSTTVATSFAAGLQVVVLDASANPVEGLTVAFTGPTSGPGLSPAGGVAVTDTTGKATFLAAANTVAGNYQVLAAVAGPAPAAFALTNVAGAASTFVVSAVGHSETGTPFDLAVRAVDLYGNTATGYTGTVGVRSSDTRGGLPGDFTFTAADAGIHVFSGGIVLHTLGEQTVTVVDRGNPTLTATVDVFVTGTAPTVTVPGDGLAVTAVGETLVRTGSFRDPDPDTWRAVVDYGDGSGFVPLALAPDRSFTLAHRYDSEGNFLVAVRVTDSEGLSGTTTLDVAVFLPGIDLTQVGEAIASPGQKARASAPGIRATLERSAEDTGSGELLVAPVPVPVAGGLSLTSSGTPIVEAFDVRGVDLTSADTAIITFDFVGAGVPVLDFFDPASGTFQPVQGSVLASPTPSSDRTGQQITVVFDRTSMPSLSRLRGTVFTVSVALPPASPDASLQQASFELTGHTESSTAGQVAPAATGSPPSSAALVLAALVTNTLSPAVGGEADQVAHERSVLFDLPAVQAGTTASEGSPAALILSPSQAGFSAPWEKPLPTVPPAAESRAPGRWSSEEPGRTTEAAHSTVLSEEEGEERAVETEDLLPQGGPAVAVEEPPSEQAIDWLMTAGLLVVAGVGRTWERRQGQEWPG